MKKMIQTVLIVFIIALMLVYFIYSSKVDTIYAMEYSQVFGSYNIKMVDEYLSMDTKITYKGVTDTYKNLRGNVINAFEEKEFEMSNRSSYGHGDDIFIFGKQEIFIMSYIESKAYTSDTVHMVLERNALVFYKINSITSEDDFFGYLFFGIKK